MRIKKREREEERSGKDKNENQGVHKQSFDEVDSLLS